MKRKLIKIALTFSLLVCLVLSLMVPSSALPINNVTDNYFYNLEYQAVDAPLAFTTEKVISLSNLLGSSTSTTNTFRPSDVFFRNGLLYILDRNGNRIYILDEQYQVVSVVERLSGDIPPLAIVQTSSGEEGEEGGSSGSSGGRSNTSFASPEGIYVTEDERIFVADTENQRIVVCDRNGLVSKVYQSIRVSVLGENYVFKPTKIVVDNTGDLQIIASGINRGIMQVDSDGNFRAFFGTPSVIVSLWERIWRAIATEQQQASLNKFVPTEYSNLTVDSRGFIYPTTSALGETAVMQLSRWSKTSNYAPVKKLTADGTDVLRRKGLAAPMGDLLWADYDVYPLIVDVAVDSDSGRYTLLDQRTGRFFTYDNDGNLLYMGGGSGTQAGKFSNACGLAINGDYYYVADSNNKTVTVFKATDYVHAINQATEATANGLWEESIPLWNEVLNYNSNMFIAYIGLGKAEMRIGMTILDDDLALEHYARAVDYLSHAGEKENYSMAYAALRTDQLEENFTLIVVTAIVLIVGIMALVTWRKIVNQKKKKAAELAAAAIPKITKSFNKKRGDE